MDKTIIGGRIEFLNRKLLIHSIDEVYSAGSPEEQDALEEMLDNQEGVDWVVVEEYTGTFEVTNKGLLSLLGRISGVNKKEQ